jgi:hypothetical protein
MNSFFRKNRQGYLSILILLLSLGIIFFVLYLVLKNYYQAELPGQSPQKIISELSNASSHQQPIVDTIRERVKRIQEERLDFENVTR